MDDVIAFGVIAIAIIAIVQITLNKVARSRKGNGRVSEIMERDGLSFECAKEKLLTEKIAKIVEVERITAKLGDFAIKQGDRISFLHNDDKVYINGDFIGTKDSMAEGYTEHICIRTDAKILYFPMEVMDLTTLRVIER